MDDTALFPADATPAGDAATPAADAKPAEGAADAKPAEQQAVDTSTPPADAKPADEAKPADAKPAEAKADEKPTGAPEAYADFTAPEGYELDQALLGEFTPLFKELNLTQEGAQKLLDAAPKLVAATTEKTTEAVLAAVGLADRGTWAQQVREDKTLGGEKVAENVAIARRGADALFSPETKAFLAKTGLGNHPALVRDMHRFGQTLSEDGFVPGGKNATPKTAQSFYDKSPMNP